MMDKMSSGSHGMEIKLKTTQPKILQNVIRMRIMLEFSIEDVQFRVLFTLYLVLLSSGKYRFSQIQHLIPPTEKLYACTKLLRKLKLSGDTWKLQHSTQVHIQYIGRITKSCISVVQDKRVTPRVKHIDIPVCFIQEKFDNVLFLPKYEKSIVMPADMCTKPCSGHIISRSTKWMT